MSSGDDPRPGTTASLDRRVERLEEQFGQLRTEVSELKADLQLIKQEQRHAGELMTANFKNIEHSVSGTLAEIKALAQRFDAAMLQGASISGDPTATPAGRQILAQMAEIETAKDAKHAELSAAIEINSTRIDGIDRRVWMALGAISLAILVLQVAVPIVLHYL